MYGYGDGYTGLGLGPLIAAPAVAPAVSTAGKVIGAVGSFVGSLFGGHSKDAERYAKNEAYYAAASSGDPDALLALKGMSGQYGLIPKGTPPTGSKYCPCSGWATADTRADALRKYNAAAASGVPASQPGGGMFPAVSAAGFGGSMLPLLAGGALLLVMTQPKRRR